MAELVETHDKRLSVTLAVFRPNCLRDLIVKISLCLHAFVVPANAREHLRLDDDRATIDTCLQRAKLAPEQCIGTVFRACVEAPNRPNDTFRHDSTAGQSECAKREIAVWDEKIGASLQQLRSGPLGATIAQPWNRPQQNKRDQAVPGIDIIDDMERAWTIWRAKMCDTAAMQYEGGTLSSVVYGKCVYMETGRHALWLLQQVEDNAPR
jgi:uncharacterized protein YecT (DUF1311 family)